LLARWRLEQRVLPSTSLRMWDYDVRTKRIEIFINTLPENIAVLT